MKRLIHPSASLKTWLEIGGVALGGALIAGTYGVIHDQITYTISPEYFTRMKFQQFRYADFGLSERMLVAEIGWLASWWVGLISMWFFGRLTFMGNHSKPIQACMLGCAVIVGIAAAGGVAGYWFGPRIYSGLAWRKSLQPIGVADGHAFTRVAGIHLGSYLGALTGWLVAMVLAWRGRKTSCY